MLGTTFWQPEIVPGFTRTIPIFIRTTSEYDFLRITSIMTHVLKLLTLKCVTRRVRICVDMPGTHSDNYQWSALVTPHWSPHIITKFNIVRTTLYYITEHVVLLVDTLHCPRWNNYVILVSRHVLSFTHSASSMFLWHNNLVTCPARRWRTPWCMSGAPECISPSSE